MTYMKVAPHDRRDFSCSRPVRSRTFKSSVVLMGFSIHFIPIEITETKVSDFSRENQTKIFKNSFLFPLRIQTVKKLRAFLANNN